MPSKIILHRPPLLVMKLDPLINGCIKTEDSHINEYSSIFCSFCIILKYWLSLFKLLPCFPKVEGL